MSRSVRSGVGFSRQHLGDDRLHARAGERRIAGEHLVRHRAERVDVAARVDRPLTHRLLGRHVLRRAERQSGLRHARAAGRLHGERDAEVGDERVPVLQQDVLRLDVAVDDRRARAHSPSASADLARDAYRVVDRQLPLALEPGAQRLAGHERHHVVQQSVGVAAVEQRKNVRMLQTRRRADLGEEPLAAERRAELGMEDLDGDVAVVLQVVREIHGRHAAGAELALDAIALGECGRQIFQRVCHSGAVVGDEEGRAASNVALRRVVRSSRRA